VKEVIRILLVHGYSHYGWKGSHYRMARNGNHVSISTNARLSRGYFNQIMKKAGIDWRKEGL